VEWFIGHRAGSRRGMRVHVLSMCGELGGMGPVVPCSWIMPVFLL
jgi:hypothetical protein